MIGITESLFMRVLWATCFRNIYTYMEVSCMNFSFRISCSLTQPEIKKKHYSYMYIYLALDCSHHIFHANRRGDISALQDYM